MYCGKCGSQISDSALFCPVCGNKNDTVDDLAGLDQQQSGWQTGTVLTPNYSPVQPPDKQKNRKVLIIVISIAAVLLAIGIIATAIMLGRMRSDNDSDRNNVNRQTTRSTTNIAVAITEDQDISSIETTRPETSADLPTSESENNETATATSTETTPAETEPIYSETPGIIPDHIWEYTDFDAELVDYAGHYKGYITTTVYGIDQIDIFNEPDRRERLTPIMSATGTDYFTDLFVGEDYLEAYSEHPIADEEGMFINIYPFELLAGGYFEEYSNDSFDGTDVAMYGYVQTAFYQQPNQQPGFYLLNYEEYNWNGEYAYFEIRIDVRFIE